MQSGQKQVSDIVVIIRKSNAKKKSPDAPEISFYSEKLTGEGEHR